MTRAKTEPKKRHYPANRKKPNRSKESYRANSPEALEKQRANLRIGRGPKKWQAGTTIKGAKPSRAVLEAMDIIQFAEDILGLSFDDRPAQKVILKALYGLPLTDDELEIYSVLTKGEKYVARERSEAVLVLGARSGKSFLSAVIACYEAIVNAEKWRRYLNPGEVGYILIVATRLLQSQQIIGAAVLRMLNNSKVSHYIDEAIATEIKLTNDLTIMSMPCNSTSGRGLPICCLILDELAWYRQEGPRQDDKIFKALRPRMSQFRGAKFLAISTPASKQGLLYSLYDEGLDKDRPTPNRLTVQGPTLLINPMVDPEFLESEKKRDPDNFDREFQALFCEQTDAFFPEDLLNKCFTLSGDIAYDSRYRYFAAVDQSGLSGNDLFAFSIAHTEKERTILDVQISWCTRDGDKIVKEIADVCGRYGIMKITIDRYGSGWVRQSFENAGFEVDVRPMLPQIYVNLKSLVISGRVSLPDIKGLRQGLLRTVGFYGRSATLSIGHERSKEGHGDEADSCACAVWLASKSQSGGLFYV